MSVWDRQGGVCRIHYLSALGSNIILRRTAIDRPKSGSRVTLLLRPEGAIEAGK
jgi:hypothetical protein